MRPVTLEDVDALHRIFNEPGVRKYLWDDEIVPRTRVESIVETSQAAFASEASGLWNVFLKHENVLIGFAGFWKFHDPPILELLYGIEPAYWHRGLATEAGSAILKYGFDELSFKRIEASTDAGNEASVRVMQRLGMTFWKREITNGLDTIYYAIPREDFEYRRCIILASAK
jgi:ribosomal-protein-alanine N-acetyltransferase